MSIYVPLYHDLKETKPTVPVQRRKGITPVY